MPPSPAFELLYDCDSVVDSAGRGASDDDVLEQEQEMPPVERSLESLDMDALVQRILRTHPSLKSAKVTVQGHSTRFFVTRQNGPDIVYEEDISSREARL